MIRRNYAKSIQGFKTRILAKITALILGLIYFSFDIKFLAASKVCSGASL
jgi:hypothetical protein